MATIMVKCIKCKNMFKIEMIGDGTFTCPYCNKKYIRRYEKNGNYYIGEYKDDRR